MFRNNEIKIAFLKCIFYCIFFIVIYSMAQCHGIEPICNLRSVRECVYMCVSVSQTSFGKNAGPRHADAPLKRYSLTSSC